MTLVRLRNRDYAPARPSYRGMDDMFNWFAGEMAGHRACNNHPSVNILENDDDFRIEMLVPGYRKEDIRVQFESGILTVSHEAPETEGSGTSNYLTREFQTAGFERSFRLSDRLASEKISARYENGILEVTIPKKEEAKAKPAREISIK